MIIVASRPFVHQNWTGHGADPTTKPLKVGPVTTPSKKERFKAVKASSPSDAGRIDQPMHLHPT